MDIDIHALRAGWRKARRLGLRQCKLSRPDEEQQLADVRQRLHDLADALEFMYGIYRRDGKRGLYGDDFLAFIGDKLIRYWPGKDFPFFSEEAAAIAAQYGVTLRAGQTFLPAVLKGKLHPEHWTPISFFRDVFHVAREQDAALTQSHFYELLVHYYRVVWVSKREEKDIDKHHRAARDADTYEQLGIVVDHPLWEQRDEAGCAGLQSRGYNNTGDQDPP